MESVIKVMKEKLGNEVKKSLLRAFDRINDSFDKSVHLFKYIEFIYHAKTCGCTVSFGDDTIINQKTLVSGKGHIAIGNSCRFGSRLGGYYYGGICELQSRYKNSKIVIGNNVSTNNNLFICAAKEIIIRSNTIIGGNVMMIDHDGHGIHPNNRRNDIGKVAAIHIGKNVWIGSRVTILPGTTIGNNCIVGAGALVKGIFPDNTIIAGNPAKIIKTINL